MKPFQAPHSRITIGSVTFLSCHSVDIEKSVKDFEARAIITLPRNFAKRNGKGVTDVIHRGDAVTIELGYDDDFFVEFAGYVDVIGSSTPLVIDCDGEWFPHKKNELTPKTIQGATIKDVLSHAFPSYTIDCPDAKLNTTFMIGKVSSFAVIKSLRESTGLYAKIYDVKKKLTCYYPFDAVTITNHFYVFGTRDETLINGLRTRKLFPNVKKNNLKFLIKGDLKISLTAKSKTRDGKNFKVHVGSDDVNAEKRTRNFGYEFDSENELRAAAEKDLKLMNFDGYQGTIIGFGYPRIDAGDSLTIIDPENPEREGTYLVEKVKIQYSVNSGYERVITLSYKIR